MINKEDTYFDQDRKESKKEKINGWHQAGFGAAGMGAGIMMGAVAPSIANAAAVETHDAEVVETTESHPEWTDGQVAVASSVTDDMSFGQAFAAARAEVGSGGVFEWRGNIYNTYTEAEWKSMSAAEKAEYGSHFNYHSNSNVQHDDHHSTASHSGTDHQHSDSDGKDEAQKTMEAEESGDGVEVLGVVHDDETGYNLSTVSVDGHDVVLIDVDGDMNADYAATDIDGDGQVSPEEIVDISGSDVSMMASDSFVSPDAGMEVFDDAGTFEA